MDLTRWFANWFGGRKTSGFAAVRSTISPGEAMRIGDVQVEIAGGSVLVACGRRGAFVVTPDLADGRATVQCYSDGEAMPEKVLVKKAPRGVAVMSGAADPPLIRLGPGGDYVQNWPREESLSRAAERVRRVPKNVQPACT